MNSGWLPLIYLWTCLSEQPLYDYDLKFLFFIFLSSLTTLQHRSTLIPYLRARGQTWPEIWLYPTVTSKWTNTNLRVEMSVRPIFWCLINEDHYVDITELHLLSFSWANYCRNAPFLLTGSRFANQLVANCLIKCHYWNNLSFYSCAITRNIIKHICIIMNTGLDWGLDQSP